jgi:hypothetical protein
MLPLIKWNEDANITHIILIQLKNVTMDIEVLMFSLLLLGRQK